MGTPREPPPGPPVSRQPSPAQLALVRIAMLAGVLAFGGVTWVLRRGAPPAVIPTPRALDYARLGVWGITIAVVLVVRMRLDRITDPARRATLSIVGWAAGELSALFGAVHYFLTGDPRWYLIGILLLLVAFLLIPLRRTR
jgi:hypothetical protein